VEVSNEVYQAELGRWINNSEKRRPDGGEVEGLGARLGEVGLGEEAEKEEVEEPRAERTEGWRQQKAVSGLGSLLRQLQGDAKAASVADMSGGEEEEGPEERRVGREEETEAVPGLEITNKTFDQLGFVFESEAGRRWQGTPAVRYHRLPPVQSRSLCMRVFQSLAYEYEPKSLNWSQRDS
jgi:hypothetical protein